MILLAYGPISDLIAIQKTRAEHSKPRRKNEPGGDVSFYLNYARRLAREFRHDRPGAGPEDVEQQALIAAWEAIGDYRPGARSERVFVFERMRWRVIDFVRVRGNERIDLMSVPIPEEML